MTSFTRIRRGPDYEQETVLIMRPGPGGRQWLLSQKSSRACPETRVDVETLKTIVMFCAVGLTVSLMLASYGLDLSPGLF